MYDAPRTFPADPADDLARELAALAAAGSRSASVSDPAGIRDNADRRRARRRASAAAAGVLGVVALAIALGRGPVPADGGLAGQPDGDPTTTATASATEMHPTGTATEPSPTGSASAATIPLRPAADAQAFGTGDRQFALLPVGRSLAVVVAPGSGGFDPGSHLMLHQGLDQTSAFVLVPTSPGSTAYLVKTGFLQVGGEPLCVTAGYRASLTIAVWSCDAADPGQVWTLSEAPEGSPGAPAYGLTSADGYALAVDGDALVIARAGSAAGGRAFHLADVGKAALPTIG